MFKLTLLDRKGIELKQGDIVRISDGKSFKFYSEVKYLENEEAIAPFHTFSFHSFEKVERLPEGAKESSEERYKIWYLSDAEPDEAADQFNKYLLDWRACEHLLKCFKIEPMQ